MAASSSDFNPSDPDSKEHHQIIFTQDELRVIKECKVESFYYRCVPLSTLFSGLAYIGMKNGHLSKSNIKYGYLPKMMAGAIFGYVLGKISYSNACAEKLMKLENSPLADNLRKRRGRIRESSFDEAVFAMKKAPSELYGEDVPIIEDRSPDLSDHMEGADSYSQVTESLSPYSSYDEDVKSSRSFISYDDLRRQNREEHLNKMMEKYKKSPTSQKTPSDPSIYDSDVREPKPAAPFFDTKKNKYGDVWDD